MDQFDQIKNRDPYTFIRADDFFDYFDTNLFDTGIKQPESVSHHDEDQPQKDGKAIFGRGKVFRLHEALDDQSDDQSFLLIEFIRPRVWRIRFDPIAKSQPTFKDENSRAIMYPTMSELIQKLDDFERVNWDVELTSNASHYILESVTVLGEDKKRPEIRLLIQKDPFQITALGFPECPTPKFLTGTTTKAKENAKFNLESSQGVTVIWKTKPKPLMYLERGRGTILSIQAPASSHYLGFGEQGGRDLFKDKTYMNYFNFDNMKYQNVYGSGPLDPREPLYHTEPYWMEVTSHAGFDTVLGTLVDNYSHTCIDVRQGDPNTLRIGTRFNEFNSMILAADKASDLFQNYTSIVGKPSLRPRYALGYHQGSYGYDTRELVEQWVTNYQSNQFPIDGLHIDIDIQREYQTFTINTDAGIFPEPEEMFMNFRKRGIKCCTNITPHINSRADPKAYSTLKELLDNEYYVSDVRDVARGVKHPTHERYHNFDNGKREMIRPSEQRPTYNPPDDYTFSELYNTGKPFHGGVYYGAQNGAPTYYPNLNYWVVREWWGRQYQYLFECGLEFVWQDMTSPAIAKEYGDLKSFPYRLVIDCDTLTGEPGEKRRAIDLWALYAYNLHKATYQGLRDIHKVSNKLKWREGRRNFIIGRGSYTGSHRFAGLWTGDNSSTWDFFSISVVQVLALGISGNAITGQDVGGFEPAPGQDDWADPQLLIRWYGAYSLLPWFRNHYTKRRYFIENPAVQRKHGKLFQEPYAFQDYYEEHEEEFKDPREALLFRSVLPLCRYHVRLRYSLMQLLYDAMFENAITGMPIARSMNKHYTNDQYLVRNDLLVAPPMRPEEESNGHQVYLPYPDEWFPMNLRPDEIPQEGEPTPSEHLGVALEPAIAGGTHVSCDCNISDEEARFPTITPMYIREGAIIPRIRTKLSTPDWYPKGVPDDADIPAPEASPITIHVYPGKNNLYKMYIDDGISIESEPLARMPEEDQNEGRVANQYSEVHIQQTSGINEEAAHTRVLTISSPWNNYDHYKSIVGPEYTVVFWHKFGDYNSQMTFNLFYGEEEIDEFQVENKERLRASVIRIPTDKAHKDGVKIILTY
ncbi:glycoside hydrolase family 31 protein [Trichoderma camerunense]